MVDRPRWERSVALCIVIFIRSLSKGAAVAFVCEGHLI
jgi:hypothetical protein